MTHLLQVIAGTAAGHKKALLLAAAAVLLLLGASALVLPIVAKQQAEAQLRALTGRNVAIAGVSFNPLGMTLTIKDFRFMEQDNATPFVEFDRLKVSLSSMSIVRRAAVIDQLLLENPRIRLVRTAANRYNFSDILERLAARPKQEQRGESRFSLNNISISGGSIDFSDQAATTPVTHTVRELRLDVPFISNIPYLAEKYTDPQFSAVVNGGKLRFNGKAKPLAAAVEASLQVKLDNLSLPYFQPYIPANLPVRLDGGLLTLDWQVTYRIHKAKQPELLITGLTRLDGIDLKEKHGAPLAAFRRFEVQARELELFSRRAAFQRIALHDPLLHLSRDGAGRLNLQRLVSPSPVQPRATTPKAKAAPPSGPPLALTVGELLLDNGAVQFRDTLPRGGFTASLSGIAARITDLSTAAGARAAAYTLSLKGDRGESLTAKGTATLSPLAITSDVSLAGVALQRGWPYLQHLLQEPVKGTVAVAGSAAYSTADGLSLRDTSLHFRELSARYGHKDGAELSRIDIDGISFAQKGNRAEVNSIDVGSGTVRLSRESDGTLSPLLLLQKPAAAAPPAQAPPPAKAATAPLNYQVNGITVNGLSISFRDRITSNQPHFSLGNIRLKTGNLTGPHSSAMPLSFSATYGRRTPISINGSLTPQPLRYKGTVAFSRLPIRDFEEYIPDSINLFFVAGTLDSRMALDISLPPGGKPTGSFSGSAGVRGFHVVDTVMEEDLLKWESLQLDQINGRLEPFSLAIRQIALNGVYSRIAVRKDRTLNLQNLVRKPETAAAATQPGPPQAVQQQSSGSRQPQPPATQAGKGSIRIDTLTIQDGTLVFSDAHLPQQFKTTFHNLGGRVSGLSSEMNTRAEVDLRGNLENRSPLQITGTVNPLRDDLFVDLTISFKDIELSPATPYSGTYLGYTIDRGKLFLDLKYHIENKNLAAENKIFVDQFTFGDSVESDKATKLPVRLGVALLKDKNGQINLDLPVSGRTDDPQFSIWGVVWKVVQNLFIKAATSPFSLLASMMGSSEDLSAVSFKPGSSTLSETEEKKLSLLAKALTDRPGLKVEISGFIDKAADPEGYRAEVLEQKMRQEKYRELSRGRQRNGAGQPTADQVEIRPEDASRLLKAVYLKEKFPKPRNLIGMLKDLPDAEMRKLIIANTIVGEQELQQLAAQRAATVQQYLVSRGALDSQRLFLKRDDIYKAPKQEKGTGSRVELTPLAQ